MIDGSEKRNGWLNFEPQSPHVIERRSKCQLPSICVPSFMFIYICVNLKKRAPQFQA